MPGIVPGTPVSTTFLSPAASNITTTPGQLFNGQSMQLITWASTDMLRSATFNLSGFPCSPQSCSSLTSFEGRLYPWTPLASDAQDVVGSVLATGVNSAAPGLTVPFSVQSEMPLMPPQGPSLPASCPNAASSTMSGAPCLSLVPEPASCSPTCFAGGFADPSIRRDPSVFGTGLWMAYSFGESCSSTGPACGAGGSTPAIGIHLVASHNGGATWTAPTTLYPPRYVLIDSPSCNSYLRQPGYAYTSHEGVSLAPDGVGNWYAVRQEYCVKVNSSALYTDIYPYTGALILDEAATSPTNLQSPSMSARFQNAALSTKVGLVPGTCMSFNEAALLIANANIYLFFQCLPPPNSTLSPQYFTLSVPTASNWTELSSWSVLGPSFGGLVDAQRYHPAATFLTEFDIAARPDGTFVAVFTPASGLNPELHLGCVAAAFTLPTSSSTINNYIGETYAQLDDAVGSATAMGNSGCSYDPASATGLLLSRKVKTSVEQAHRSWKPD